MPFWKRKPEPSQPPSEGGRRGIAFGLASDVGQVRSTNQDRVFALLTSLPAPGGQLQLGLFIVADGMGGHDSGAEASTCAIEVVAGQVLQELLLPVLRQEPPEAIQTAMRDALLAANRRILDEAILQGSDMGTTLTAALVLVERLHIAHVGDSRLYTYGKEGLRVRTRDHSVVARLLELGQIKPEEARHHPKRNFLYQSIGQQEEINVQVDSFSLEGCSHLLLCCDGLWGSLTEETLVESLERKDDPQEICETLVREANAAGGEDNISVIVVAFPTPSGGPSS